MKYEEGSYGGHERWFVKVVHKGRKWVLGYENVDNKTPQMCGQQESGRALLLSAD